MWICDQLLKSHEKVRVQFSIVVINATHWCILSVSICHRSRQLYVENGVDNQPHMPEHTFGKSAMFFGVQPIWVKRPLLLVIYSTWVRPCRSIQWFFLEQQIRHMENKERALENNFLYEELEIFKQQLAKSHQEQLQKEIRAKFEELVKKLEKNRAIANVSIDSTIANVSTGHNQQQSIKQESRSIACQTDTTEFVCPAELSKNSVPTGHTDKRAVCNTETVPTTTERD